MVFKLLTRQTFDGSAPACSGFHGENGCASERGIWLAVRTVGLRHEAGLARALLGVASAAVSCSAKVRETCYSWRGPVSPGSRFHLEIWNGRGSVRKQHVPLLSGLFASKPALGHGTAPDIRGDLDRTGAYISAVVIDRGGNTDNSRTYRSTRG